MYLDTQKPKECCGCTACMSICPKSAIEMQPDNHGFLAPVIDKGKCIQCDLCRKVCDFNREAVPSNTVIAAYGMHHKKEEILRSSRSGGAFYMLAQQILDVSGLVWGAAFDDNLNVMHREARTPEELRTLQGSKYVQSNLKDTFKKVKDTLISDRWVLFSGTACQVAGLLSYLNMQNVETRKLITCDIICQGVPSPLVFEDYKKYLEEKYNDKLLDFNFRDSKRIGWKGHEESFTFKANNKRYFSRKYTNYYYHYYMRESCFSCKYAGTHRPGDFSLGDFWGVSENYPYFANEEGNSLILINTEKGLHFFDKAKIYGEILKVDLDKCLQPRLRVPSKRPQNYEQFWEEYETRGYTYCIKKYGKDSFKSVLVYFIKPILRELKSRKQNKEK